MTENLVLAVAVIACLVLIPLLGYALYCLDRAFVDPFGSSDPQEGECVERETPLQRAVLAQESEGHRRVIFRALFLG